MCTYWAGNYHDIYESQMNVGNAIGNMSLCDFIKMMLFQIQSKRKQVSTLSSYSLSPSRARALALGRFHDSRNNEFIFWQTLRLT